MRGARSPAVSAAVLVLLSSTIAGCNGKGGTGMGDRPYEYDTQVTRALREFHQSGPQGAERRLDAFTTFDWDTVHLFGEGNTYRLIDTTVGAPVFGRDGRYLEQGSLLIFTSGGRVVHAVALVPPIVEGNAHTYQRENAVLRARTKDPGPYQLDLTSKT